MFTGIVDHVGEVVAERPGAGGGRTLTVRHRFGADAIAIGDSISHDGVCLTATSLASDTYTIDVGPETLARTTMGDMHAGTPVNLELAATLSTRLGGHLVQGHVDGVGRIVSLRQRENAWDLDVEVPVELLPLIVPRGSVTVDGISLTVTGRSERTFSLSIIPHTWKITSLAKKGQGSPVNVEVDLIARYVQGLLEGYRGSEAGGITEAFLRKHGF